VLTIIRRAFRSFDGRVAVVMLLSLLVFVLVAPFLLPDPNHSFFPPASSSGPSSPSLSHPLGTDGLHRDVLARLATGGRLSLAIAVAASTIALVVGGGLGILGAHLQVSGRRRADFVLMRILDVVLAVPFLLFASLAYVLLGETSMPGVVLVMSVFGVGGIARLVRLGAVEAFGSDYAIAARGLGASTLRIAAMHVVPNVLHLALVVGFSLVATMILTEAALGYLSVGLPPPTASWGRMLHEGETMISRRPLLVLAPSFAIFVSMAGFSRAAEVLNRAFATHEDRSRVARRPPIDVALFALAALLIGALPPRPLGAPTTSRSAASTEAPRRDLRLATFVAVRSIDSVTAFDELSVALGRNVYGRLFTLDEHGGVVPEIGTGVTWANDGLSLVVTLRDDVVFHDGARLSAADVKRSFERALGPKSACPATSYYGRLAGFDAFREGRAPSLDGVQVVDERHVRFVLAERDATFLALLTLGFVAPVCPSVTSPADGHDTSVPCGAGAFTVQSFEPEDRVLLRRFPGYFGADAVRLDGVEMTFNVKPTVQRYRFERGELDVLRDLGSADALTFRNDPRWSAYGRWSKSLRTNAVFLNTEMPPFDDADVRRAVRDALDMSVLTTLRHDQPDVGQVVPPWVPNAPALPRDERSPEQRLTDALASMARAGHAYDPARGTGGYPRSIEYVTVSDSFEQQVAEVIAQQLARVGLRIKIRALPFQAYLAEVTMPGRATMGWAGWGADFPDPLSFFEPTLTSGAIGKVSQNYAFFRNARFDAVTLEARNEPDPAKRNALFVELERIVRDEAPWVPTHAETTYAVVQPYVLGLVERAGSELDFRTVDFTTTPAAGEAGP
jgi:ABC-type transport system substrate-binding protein/ABC-type dipeptide/oligopeptide/nickel transport system permease subunit